MSNHKHRLIVVALIDGAGVLGVTHAGHPGQPNDTVLAHTAIIQIETCQQQSVVPVVCVGRVSSQQGARVLRLLPTEIVKCLKRTIARKVKFEQAQSVTLID